MNKIMNKKSIVVGSLILLVLMVFAVSQPLHAQPQQAIPKITIGLDSAQKPGDVAVTLQILLLMTVLSLVLAIIILMTSFTRIAIVFSFLKQALESLRVQTSRRESGESSMISWVICPL